MFIAALFIMAKKWKQFKCSPTIERINKHVVCPYNGTFHRNKKGNKY